MYVPVYIVLAIVFLVRVFFFGCCSPSYSMKSSSVSGNMPRCAASLSQRITSLKGVIPKCLVSFTALRCSLIYSVTSYMVLVGPPFFPFFG